METIMAAEQIQDSKANVTVAKEPNGRVRVVIEELSIAGNMMDVEEGVLQYLNQAGTAIIKEALQQHDVEGDPLFAVWKMDEQGAIHRDLRNIFRESGSKKVCLSIL